MTLFLAAAVQPLPPSLRFPGNLGLIGSITSGSLINNLTLPDPVCTEPTSFPIYRPIDCQAIIDNIRADPRSAERQVFVSVSPFPTPGQIQVPIVWVHSRCYVALRAYNGPRMDVFSYMDVANEASRIKEKCAQWAGKHRFGGWGSVGNANSFAVYIYAK